MNVAYMVCLGFCFVCLSTVQTPSWLCGLGVPWFGTLVLPVFSPPWTRKRQTAGQSYPTVCAGLLKHSLHLLKGGEHLILK